VFWLCETKRHKTDGEAKFINHEILKKYIIIEDLPILEDYSLHTKLLKIKCEYEGCLNTDVELHHWAPRFAFENNADRWPKSYLCRKHHQQWHILVTPKMSKNGHL